MCGDEEEMQGMVHCKQEEMHQIISDNMEGIGTGRCTSKIDTESMCGTDFRPITGT